MILILSSEDDLHVQRVVSHLPLGTYQVLNLRTMGVVSFLEFDPVNGSSTISFLNNSQAFSLSDITSIWYRRPRYKRGSEGGEEWKRVFAENEERCVFDGMWRYLGDTVRWLNNPFANRMAENKLWQLYIAKEIGFELPQTLVTNNPDSLRRFANENGDIVYKPVAKSHIERPNDAPLIFLTKPIKKFELDKLVSRVSVTPCLFQKYIEKQFEIRVTILGDQVFAAAQYSQENMETRHDWRRDPTKVRHEKVELPTEIQQRCIALVRKMGLTFGAIDIIFTPDERFIFLEINPNGQWLWIEDLVAHPISHAIATMLQGA